MCAHSTELPSFKMLETEAWSTFLGRFFAWLTVSSACEEAAHARKAWHFQLSIVAFYLVVLPRLF